MIAIGEKYVDPERIVAVERLAHSFDCVRQDWFAVLVFDGGARVPVQAFVKDVLRMLDRGDSPP